MPILTHIPIALTVEEVLDAQGIGSPSRHKLALAAKVGRAIELAQTLCKPMAVYAELEIQSVDDERVTLIPSNGQAGGTVLKVGPHADLLAPATTLFAAAYTIGPALEKRASRLNRAGEILVAYWLDVVGVMALGAIGEALYCIAEERASERDCGVSAALSPGSLAGWSVQGQRELCALLPLADIGLRLNEHCMLEPYKSVSMVVGLGPGYDSHQVGSVCRYCALADSCWRRR